MLTVSVTVRNIEDFHTYDMRHNLLKGRSVAESSYSPDNSVADATSTSSMPRKGYATTS